MLNLLKNFVSNEDGLEMVEWAIVAALVTAAGAGAFAALGTNVTTALTTLSGIVAP